MSNGFPEVGAVHEVATQELLMTESPISQNRPPIFAVEYFFLRNIPFSGLLFERVKRRLCPIRKRRGSSFETGSNRSSIEKRKIVSVPVKIKFEPLAQPKHVVVVQPDPLPAQFTDQAGCLLKPVRMHSTT